MDVGAAHMHARVGLEDTYLGPRFMDMIRYCNQEFKKRDMLTWLYDEDRYPSGYAGGLVTKERKYRTQDVYKRQLFNLPRMSEKNQIKALSVGSGFPSAGTGNRVSD